MRFVAALLAGLALGAPPRAGFQQTLGHLVTGIDKAAPGAAAYVSGPKGTWSGSAGYANLVTKKHMDANARMRLGSLSKLWTATVVVKLATEHKLGLDDTVEQWLPGLFSEGGRMTIRQLLNHTSGMIDNNDLFGDPQTWLKRIPDPALRDEWAAALAAVNRDPNNAEIPDLLQIRVAAALPLLTDPDTNYHYSNIGYKVAALIAEKASGETLPELYRRVIIAPLGLASAAYAPRTIPGTHPVAYAILADGKPRAGTNWGAGFLGAEGSMVASARDEARFLVALVRGKLVPTKDLFTGSRANPDYALGVGIEKTCAGRTYSHNGATVSWTSSVAVSADGRRVAVLLLNGRSYRQSAQPYAAALFKLFCAA